MSSSLNLIPSLSVAVHANAALSLSLPLPHLVPTHPSSSPIQRRNRRRENPSCRAAKRQKPNMMDSRTPFRPSVVLLKNIARKREKTEPREDCRPVFVSSVQKRLVQREKRENSVVMSSSRQALGSLLLSSFFLSSLLSSP
jgi:hypothetical protein